MDSTIPAASSGLARPVRRRTSSLVLIAALAGCHQASPGGAAGGDARTGAEIVVREACGSCHRIPGVALADGNSGPPLAGIGRRIVLAGKLPNSADNMVRWLMRPQSVEPGNAMPDTGLSEREARDVAAFLYTLR